MLSWGRRKQIEYLAGLFAMLFLVGFAVYFFVRQNPTCFDGKKNQSELGVDCGGECVKVCAEEVTSPIVEWSRVFEIFSGRFDAVAMVENRNDFFAVKKAEYSFKIYDSNGLLVVEKKGSTFMNPKEKFIVFEGGINAGSGKAATAFLEFTNLPWVRLSPPQEKPRLIVENKNYGSEPTPRLSADVVNRSLSSIKNIEVSALVLDARQNVVGASKTIIPEIGRSASQKIYFTWPQKFGGEAVVFDVTPRVSYFGD